MAWFSKKWTTKDSDVGVLIQNIGGLAKVVAIVVGAVWALVEFLNFTKANQALTIEQQQLTIAQSKLALKQADALATQQNLVIEGQRTANRLAQKNLALLEDSRFSLRLDHRVEKMAPYDVDGSSRYYVDVTTLIQNNSGEALDVVGCVLTLHVGRIDTKRTFPGNVQLLNGPPDIYGRRQLGPVEWELGSVVGYVLREAEQEGRKWIAQSKTEVPGDRIVPGGCAMRHDANVTLTTSESFLIKAKPTDILGLSVFLKLPAKADIGRPTARHEWIPFGLAAKSGVADGIEQAKR